MTAREAVLARSRGRCEALVRLPATWARCGKNVVDVHHMLKRSRGGHLLDPYEIYHLIALCRDHHRYAETSGDDSGLIIDGYVITNSITGLPEYSGPDPYLSHKYGPVGVSDLRGSVPSAQPGERTREGV